MKPIFPARAAGLALALASMALSGCISFGSEPPERLFTLTPETMAPAGVSSEVETSATLSVQPPGTPQRLNVTRIPVTMDDSSLAYLQEAFWVEKPARLFANLLAETIRAEGTRTVIGGGELDYVAPMQLSGTLSEMGYDSRDSSVIVRYDAILQMPGGEIRTQRFESRVDGVSAEPELVGPALNDAANDVAAQVAAWIG